MQQLGQSAFLVEDPCEARRFLQREQGLLQHGLICVRPAEKAQQGSHLAVDRSNRVLPKHHLLVLQRQGQGARCHSAVVCLAQGAPQGLAGPAAGDALQGGSKGAPLGGVDDPGPRGRALPTSGYSSVFLDSPHGFLVREKHRNLDWQLEHPVQILKMRQNSSLSFTSTECLGMDTPPSVVSLANTTLCSLILKTSSFSCTVVPCPPVTALLSLVAICLMEVLWDRSNSAGLPRLIPGEDLDIDPSENGTRKSSSPRTSSVSSRMSAVSPPAIASSKGVTPNPSRRLTSTFWRRRAATRSLLPLRAAWWILMATGFTLHIPLSRASSHCLSPRFDASCIGVTLWSLGAKMSTLACNKLGISTGHPWLTNSVRLETLVSHCTANLKAATSPNSKTREIGTETTFMGLRPPFFSSHSNTVFRPTARARDSGVVPGPLG
mmetsp:Transcript_84472/g.192549  ORF Transcript_84472/g.192549 Transcript_84472/m.192549 type:complete len:436 (-) Transcript_84472:1596-2903(-)